MALLMTMAALVAPQAQAAPVWEPPGDCTHAHRRISAAAGLRHHLKNFRPLVRTDRVKHFASCVRRRPLAHRLHGFARKLLAWRRGYGPSWRIRFNALAPWQRAWARNTAWCESRMYRYAVGGGGLYYSFFQWLPSTWYSIAGGDRPIFSASFYHQAVLATRLSPSHWPVCGV